MVEHALTVAQVQTKSKTWIGSADATSASRTVGLSSRELAQLTTLLNFACRERRTRYTQRFHQHDYLGTHI